MAMSPRLLRPRASGFNPKSIAGIAFWFDASNTASLAQNSDGTTSVSAVDDPVGYWGDSSGLSRNATQSVNNNRPLYKPASLNGRPTLYMNGTSSRLVTTSFALNQPATYFAVVKNEDTSGAGRHILDGASLAVGRIALYKRVSNWAMFAGTEQSSATAVNTSPVILCSNFNGASSAIFVNGASSAIGNPGNNNITGGMQISGLATVSVFFLGNIAELLAYSGTLTASQRQAVTKYLSNKWGIAIT